MNFSPNFLPRTRAILANCLGGVVLCLLATVGHAHDSRPLAVTLLETTSGVYRVATAMPPSLDIANLPRVVWPDTCRQRDDAMTTSEAAASVIVCQGGLTGRTIRIAYPIYNPAITTLFRLELENGTRRSAVLPPDELEWTVPLEPSRMDVARNYVVLGIEHISFGIDHLLFVAGLVVLAGTRRRILLAVTGFTAAHSITLSLAALEWVSVPVAPIEGLIALSIVFLARELAIGDGSSFAYRYPVVVSFVFGLLHGFGFAGALSGIGLPVSEIAMGLVGFNVGVELGQIAFVVALLSIVYAWRAVPRLSGRRAGRSQHHFMHNAAGYLLGVPATFWTLERTFTAFAG
jgi:hypothetical protein